jgi:hypothetical protein
MLYVMNTRTSPYPDFASQLAHLGLRPPSKVALLPANLAAAGSATDLKQPSEAATIRTLFRTAGIQLEDIYSEEQKPSYIKNNAADWIAPAIFIGAGVLSEHPNTVSVALNVLSNYLTDLFRGKPNSPTVKASFVVEQDGQSTYKRVEYEGPVEGLKDFGDVVRKVQRGEEEDSTDS